MSAVVVLAVAGTAAAEPNSLQPGSFAAAGAPVYAEPVDGLQCLVLDGCRGPQRQFSDPSAGVAGSVVTH